MELKALAPPCDLTILIPALNESKTIQQVIAEAWIGIQKLGVRGEVLVADNGSTDGTDHIARQSGARVVRIPVRGYGAALHFGILNAAGHWVLFGDADMSYDFSSIEPFQKYIKSNEFNFEKDLVLGSRLRGQIDDGAMPFLNRHLGTPVLNFLIRIFFGLSTSDCNSGMRLVRKSFYSMLTMRAPGMEWASELLVKSKISKVRYAEVPIHYRKDQRGKPSHLNRWVDGWRHLKTIILLSPNRLIIFPSVLSGILSAWQMSQGHWEESLVFITFATTGLSLGMVVKLILYTQNACDSRLIRYLIDRPTPETLLGLGIPMMFLGVLGYFLGNLTYPGMILSVVGAILALTAFSWGALITHAVKILTPPGEYKNLSEAIHFDEIEKNRAA